MHELYIKIACWMDYAIYEDVIQMRENVIRTCFDGVLVVVANNYRIGGLIKEQYCDALFDEGAK